MVAILNRNKSAEWIRALIGGSLSALVVGIALFLLSFDKDPSSPVTVYLNILLDLPGIFLHTWLFGDPFARLVAPSVAWAISFRIILLALVYWFLSGFGLTYFLKSNKKAIGAWLVMVMILVLLLAILW